MKTLRFSVITLTLVSVIGAARADDCTLQPEALVGALNLASPQFQKGSFAREEHGYTENVTFADGLRLTYAVGGCEHYAYSYTFENWPKGSLKTAKDAMLALAGRLNKLPLKKDAVSSLKTVRQALEAGARDATAGLAEEVVLACGDAYCTFNAREVEGKLSLSVSYNFAL